MFRKNFSELGKTNGMLTNEVEDLLKSLESSGYSNMKEYNEAEM